MKLRIEFPTKARALMFSAFRQSIQAFYLDAENDDPALVPILSRHRLDRRQLLETIGELLQDLKFFIRPFNFLKFAEGDNRLPPVRCFDSLDLQASLWICPERLEFLSGKTVNVNRVAPVEVINRHDK